MNLFKKIKEKVKSPEFKEKLKNTCRGISKASKVISKGAGKLSNRTSNYWESQMKGYNRGKGKNSLF